MTGPPLITEDAVAAAVRAGYGVAAARTAFLPAGYDVNASVYRVEADDGRVYFAKARRGPVEETGLVVPRYLVDHGVTRVIAPLPATNGALWHRADGFALMLYPFVTGVTAMERGLDQRQWQAYGAVLRQVHALAVAPELARTVRRDDYTTPGCEMVRRVDRTVAGAGVADAAERELAALWCAWRGTILGLTEQTETLGRRLRAAGPPVVLCHSDIHTNNVLVDGAGQLWFVDWDDARIAPKECDLIFAIGGLSRRLVSPANEAWFLQGYGPAAIDPVALAYYRCVRFVEDVGGFGEEVLTRGLDLTTKRDRLRKLRGAFEPGAIVELAAAAVRAVA
jgi:spectinomycin phosphotransferase